VTKFDNEWLSQTPGFRKFLEDIFVWLCYKIIQWFFRFKMAECPGSNKNQIFISNPFGFKAALKHATSNCLQRMSVIGVMAFKNSLNYNQ